jgi:hypothetical protein
VLYTLESVISVLYATGFVMTAFFKEVVSILQTLGYENFLNCNLVGKVVNKAILVH